MCMSVHAHIAAILSASDTINEESYILISDDHAIPKIIIHQQNPNKVSTVDLFHC